MLIYNTNKIRKITTKQQQQQQQQQKTQKKPPKNQIIKIKTQTKQNKIPHCRHNSKVQ